MKPEEIEDYQEATVTSLSILAGMGFEIITTDGKKPNQETKGGGEYKLIEEDTLNCGELIKILSKYPADKPVKILACGSEDYESETISDVGYPNTWYDDLGEDVFIEEKEWIGIFTHEYVDQLDI